MTSLRDIKKILAAILVVLQNFSLSAQQTFPRILPDSSQFFPSANALLCSNDVMLFQSRKDPAFVAKEEKMNREILLAGKTLSNDTIITLPVVVHIISSNPAGISDLQIINGIQDLNDAFSKSGPYAASAGADTKIRFCLSQKDPDGGITTGITRTTSYFSNHLNSDIEDGRLKNLIQWDPSRFINIWFISKIDVESYVEFVCGKWYRLGVGGYATMPPGSGSTDGIVITGFGKLLAHEMGHYLGLYHTFQGGCNNNNCLTDGDRVCDTPPDNSLRPSPGCGLPDNTCSSDTLSSYSNGFFTTDVPDQISNFMDYANNACSNQFTQGQTDRMRAAINTQRSGLLQNECLKPCNENISAGFTRNNASPVPGDLINFTNNSTGASNFEWLIDGIPVASTTDFSYTFTATGKYKVTLKAFNINSCFSSYTDYIIVTCGTTARFYTDKKTIASKLNVLLDSIRFTNNSYNANTFQWLMSNNQGMTEQVVNTSDTGFTYVFTVPAIYRVRLIASNGTCIDTTGIYIINVLDPTPDAFPFAVNIYCYQQNKVRIQFCITDFGYASIPAGTPVNFYDKDPRLPGASRLSPAYYLPDTIPGGNCARCYSHILNVTYHGIEKIFIAINDSGTTLPVSLPNTPLIEKNYTNNIISSQPIKTFINASICQGQNYAGYKATGTYIDTFVSKISGCDSVRTLNLSVKPVFTSNITASICKGQNYAGHTTTGTYVDVYTAANGCDSTRTLNLTVKPVFFTTVNASICQGQNYTGHTASGTYVDVYSAINGCDSTRTLNLTVKPTYSTNKVITICEGQNYYGHTATGTYVDSFFAINGCDSVRTVQLTVLPTFKTTVNAAICQGENYAGHFKSGIYTDVFSAANGCDSTRTLFLTVNPLKFTTITTSICQGENYAGHTKTGTYTDIYKTVLGCDSTRLLNLTVKPLAAANISATICEGKDYAGHITSGVYTDVYTSANGCDSIRILRLTVNPRVYTTINAAICNGESFLAGGLKQTVTGTYYDTLKNYLGCDSVIITNLLVRPLPVPDLGEDRGVCIGSKLVLNPGYFSSYKWQNGSTANTFTTNTIGKYFVSVTDSFNCKSSDTMNLTTIHPLPANFLPSDSSLCKGNILNLKIPGFSIYNWSTGSSLNYIDITDNGTYSLQATDKYGCTGNDSMNVTFYESCVIVQIPSAFTPNNDGLNDVFKPLLSAPVSNYLFQIWNRWGQKVFETQNAKSGWDGTISFDPQGSEVFVYLISFTDYTGRSVNKKGTVLLIK